MIRRATCCCGNCTIDVDGEPAFNAICHCRNCKKRTGSAFGWSTYFADGQVGGRPADVSVYEVGGSNPQQRWFCRNCGSTLFWKAAAVPGHTGIAGGCFADRPLGAPPITTPNDGRCGWVGLPDAWRTSF